MEQVKAIKNTLDSKTADDALRIAQSIHGRIPITVSSGLVPARYEWIQTCILQAQLDKVCESFRRERTNPNPTNLLLWPPMENKFDEWIHNPKMSYFDFVNSLTPSEKMTLYKILKMNRAVDSDICNVTKIGEHERERRKHRLYVSKLKEGVSYVDAAKYVEAHPEMWR